MVAYQFNYATPGLQAGGRLELSREIAQAVGSVAIIDERGALRG